MELHAAIHEEDGSYWAEVKELPGCFASGHTLDELFDALNEAIGMCLSPTDTEDLGSMRKGPVTRVDELKLVTA